ncbi:von Willebrand factor C domain-containing protein 2-like [Haliotis rubra]|uniref:von Willebrand factor C domain-containing protein 2-like n=1 Tax=Haliotis rubra TaxID=36100 RepID=UPI001EE50B3F|nr:von Willebrand factor C domain-containing protein 2-like [Haliotis rubra]
MIGILLCLLSLCLVAVINTSPVILTTTPNACLNNGKYYMVGESFRPTPCEQCFCAAAGRPACISIDCAVAMCVDAVKSPNQCCSTCPNGLNCKHGDVIIKMGEVYHPDKATACQCNFGNPYLGFGSLELKANCTSI